jgi:hypothetical protein
MIRFGLYCNRLRVLGIRLLLNVLPGIVGEYPPLLTGLVADPPLVIGLVRDPPTL